MAQESRADCDITKDASSASTSPTIQESTELGKTKGESASQSRCNSTTTTPPSSPPASSSTSHANVSHGSRQHSPAQSSHSRSRSSCSHSSICSTSTTSTQRTSTSVSRVPPARYAAGPNGELPLTTLYANGLVHGSTCSLGNGRRGAISGPSTEWWEGKYGMVLGNASENLDAGGQRAGHRGGRRGSRG